MIVTLLSFPHSQHHYAGPHPFPTIVRDFQAVIGREARSQMLERVGRLPDHVVRHTLGPSRPIYPLAVAFRLFI